MFFGLSKLSEQSRSYTYLKFFKWCNFYQNLRERRTIIATYCIINWKFNGKNQNQRFSDKLNLSFLIMLFKTSHPTSTSCTFILVDLGNDSRNDCGNICSLSVWQKFISQGSVLLSRWFISPSGWTEYPDHLVYNHCTRRVAYSFLVCLIFIS